MLSTIFGKITDVFAGTSTTYNVSFCTAIYEAIRFKTKSRLLEDGTLIVNHLGIEYTVTVEKSGSEYVIEFDSDVSTTRAYYSSVDEVAYILINEKPLTALEVIHTVNKRPNRTAHSMSINNKPNTPQPKESNIQQQSTSEQTTTEAQPTEAQPTEAQPTDEQPQQEPKFTKIPELNPVARIIENEADNIFIQAAAKKFQRELEELNTMKQREELLKQQYEYQQMMIQQAQAQAMNMMGMYDANFQHDPTFAFQQYNMNNANMNIIPNHDGRLYDHMVTMPNRYGMDDNMYNDGLFAIQ